MGIDPCTNNIAEIVVVWLLLYWAYRLDIRILDIFGDSKIVIEWLVGRSSITALNLVHWCAHIRKLMLFTPSVNFAHIYREFNMEADCLSKKGIGCQTGTLFYTVTRGDDSHHEGSHIIY